MTRTRRQSGGASRPAGGCFTWRTLITTGDSASSLMRPLYRVLLALLAFLGPYFSRAVCWHATRVLPCLCLQALRAAASFWVLVWALVQPVTLTGVLWWISRPFWALNSVGIVSFWPQR